MWISKFVDGKIKVESALAFIFGIIFVSAILVFAIAIPDPTAQSSQIFIIVLGGVDKAGPAVDGGEMDEGEEARGGLVVAGGDAPELLQETHHALDAIAPGIALSVEGARVLAVGFPRDDRVRAVQVEARAQLVAVVALVGQELARQDFGGVDQVGRSRDVGGLPGCEMDRERQSVGFRQHVDLGREPAA